MEAALFEWFSLRQTARVHMALRHNKVSGKFVCQWAKTTRLSVRYKRTYEDSQNHDKRYSVSAVTSGGWALTTGSLSWNPDGCCQLILNKISHPPSYFLVILGYRSIKTYHGCLAESAPLLSVASIQGELPSKRQSGDKTQAVRET